MTDKYNLVLGIFPDEGTADRAASDIKNWDQASDQIKLGGVGVLAKDETGKIKQQKIGPRQTRKGAGIGMVLGVVVAAIPTVGLSLLGGALAGGLGGGMLGSLSKKGFKFSEKDAERLNRELDSGHAVVGVVATEHEYQQVADKLSRLGGRVQSYEVTEEALKEVESATQGAKKKAA